MEYPRVLVISHNCFSDSGSNGRTLANFFEGYSSEKLAQFYIYNENPSHSVCNHYYRVTDSDALRSLFSGNCGVDIKRDCAVPQVPDQTEEKRKPKKTPLVYLVRELVWKAGHWHGKRLNAWIDEFAPEVVLFQAGDAAFLFDFARRVCQKRNIPLVIYNSESYYFKERNYLASSVCSDFWYGILHGYFKKHAGRAIRMAKKSIYISDVLREVYDKEFGVTSETVMTSTALLNSSQIRKIDDITISYLGNLSVGRHETLIELAGIVQSVDPNLRICVYGKASAEIEKQLDNTPGIRYCGFVSYEKCVRVMKESTLLVHVENFSEFFLEDSKYAFSTKIADCLASGTCLFVYAPRELAFTQYLTERGAACVASEPQEARDKLKRLLDSEELRKQYACRAMETAIQNHSLDRNRQKFLDALCK